MKKNKNNSLKFFCFLFRSRWSEKKTQKNYIRWRECRGASFIAPAHDILVATVSVLFMDCRILEFGILLLSFSEFWFFMRLERVVFVVCFFRFDYDLFVARFIILAPRWKRWCRKAEWHTYTRLSCLLTDWLHRHRNPLRSYQMHNIEIISSTIYFAMSIEQNNKSEKKEFGNESISEGVKRIAIKMAVKRTNKICRKLCWNCVWLGGFSPVDISNKAWKQQTWLQTVITF